MEAPRRVTVEPTALSGMLREIEEANQTNEKLKEHILGILELTGEGGWIPRGRPRGTGAALGARRGPKPGGKARGEKSLKDVVGEVLERSGEALKAKELSEAVIATGYKTQAKPSSFYTAIYTAAKAHPQVKNTPEGFVFERGSASPRPAKKQGRQRGKKRSKKA